MTNMECECDITPLAYVDFKLPALFSGDWTVKNINICTHVLNTKQQTNTATGSQSCESTEPLKKEADVTELKGESMLDSRLSQTR